MQTEMQKGFPLSFQQARLWSFQQNTDVFQAQVALTLDGPLHLETLQDALQLMVDQHEILRTAFSFLPGMDLPVQVIAEKTQVPWIVLNMEDLDQSGREEWSDELFSQALSLPFNLAIAPLLRFFVLRFSAKQHSLLLSVSSFCADAATLKNIADILPSLYEACLQKQGFVEEPLQYADVSAWQNETFLEDRARLHRQFWEEAL